MGKQRISKDVFADTTGATRKKVGRPPGNGPLQAERHAQVSVYLQEQTVTDLDALRTTIRKATGGTFRPTRSDVLRVGARLVLAAAATGVDFATLPAGGVDKADALMDALSQPAGA